MKKYIIDIVLSMICLFISVSVLQAQSLKILDVDASGYPTIKAEFQAYDSDSKSIRNFNQPDDLTLTDGGIQVDVKQNDIFCPEGIAKFSLIIVLDRSTSTSFPLDRDKGPKPTIWEAVVQGANIWIDQLPPGRFECSIITFSNGFIENPFTIHTFSDDKQDLKDSLNKRKFPKVGGTDFNSAFFGDPINKGALYFAGIAKYKPIILFFTDGTHENAQTGPFKTAEVIDSVKQLDGSIYVITLGQGGGGSIGDLTQMTNQTGGQIWENLTSEDEIQGVIFDILDDIDPNRFPAPCEIEWITHCGGGEIEMTLNNTSASDTFTYTIPDSVKPKLLFDPPQPFFLNVDPGKGESKDINVNVTALQNYVDLDRYFSSLDPQFQVVGGLPMHLDKGETKSVTLRYTPTDSTCSSADVDILGDVFGSPCSDYTLHPDGGMFFIKTIDAGSSEVGKKLKTTISERVCNWTCSDIKVDNVKIRGQDAGDFTYIGPDKGWIIPAGECIDLTFEFTPSQEGDRTATFVINAVGMEHEGELIGYGIGNAGIQVEKDIVFENANCNKPTDTISIEVTNPGGVDLDLTNITITGADAASFNKLVPAANSLSIPSRSSDFIDIEFSPGKNGQNNAQLTFNTNVKSQPTVSIDLSGFLEFVDITASDMGPLDFGTICPDSVRDIEITLTNNGNVPVNVNGAVTGGFSLPASSVNITAGGNAQYTIRLTSPTEGTMNGALTLTEDFCNTPLSDIQLTGLVAAPAIGSSPDPLILTTTIGQPKSDVVTVTNTSERPINIIDIVPENQAEFTVTNWTPKTEIAPGGTFDVTVQYVPNNDLNIDQTRLIVTTKECNWEGYVDVEGRPDKSQATVSIRKDYLGIYGQQVDIDVEMKDKLQMAQAGVTTVDFSVSYDLQLLTPVGYPDNGTINLTNVALDGTNNDQVLITLTFTVRSDAVITSSVLDVSDISDPGSLASYVDDDGLFTVRPSAARLSMEDLQANTGDIVDLSFYLEGAENISTDVNQGIEATISFNATLLEPVEGTPTGDVSMVGNQSIRTITLTDLPVSENTGKQFLKSFKFKAMLGNSQKTNINIEQAVVKNGRVEFVYGNAEFTLLDVCESSGLQRLFDPYGNAYGIISVNPNPTDMDAEIDIALVEKGYTSMWIIDMQGAKIKTFFEGAMEPGKYNVKLDTQEMNTGLYLLVLQTPADIFTAKIQILK